MRGKKH